MMDATLRRPKLDLQHRAATTRLILFGSLSQRSKAKAVVSVLSVDGSARRGVSSPSKHDRARALRRLERNGTTIKWAAPARQPVPNRRATPGGSPGDLVRRSPHLDHSGAGCAGDTG